MIKKKLRLLPITLCFAFIIWVIIHANLGMDNPFVHLAHNIPWGDKIGHFCIFGGLTLLLNHTLAYANITLFKIVFFKGTIAVLSFALLEECTQLFFGY